MSWSYSGTSIALFSSNYRTANTWRILVTSTTTIGLTLAAFIALSPAAGAAQAPETPTTTASGNGANTATTAQQSDNPVPLQHLREAERLLKSVPQDSPKLKKDGKKKFSELRERFAGLMKAYQANGDPFVPAAVEQKADLKPGKEAAPVNWKEYFSDVEGDLADILGGGSSLPPSTPAGAGSIVLGTVAPAGTSGTATTPVAAPGAATPTATSGSTTTPVATADAAPVATPGATAGSQTSVSSATTPTPTSSIGTTAVVGEIGIKDLDPEVRRQLEQFRLEVELFFAATTMNLEKESTR
jgi:hypothetical protein